MKIIVIIKKVFIRNFFSIYIAILSVLDYIEIYN